LADLPQEKGETMISAVSTVIPTTASAAASLVARLGLIVTITLIALLISKQLARAASMNSSAWELTLPGILDRVLNVGIIPLSMVFVSIVLVKVLNVL
jgi:hypothetical protein